jgi:hypothetical protein
LLLLPLMGGMLVTSLIGGQVVTRTGRYRPLLIVGSFVMAAGLGLLSTMGLGTTQRTSSLFMIVLGIGMGMLMQTTMLVVQNSVGRKDMGAASGAATLFRTIGGSLGVSLLGTLYAQRLESSLTDRLGSVAGGQVSGGQLTPAMLAGLPAGVREAFQAAVTSGVHSAFLWGGAVALVAIVAAFVIRQVELRGSAPAAPTPEVEAATYGRHAAQAVGAEVVGAGVTPRTEVAASPGRH